MNSLYGNYRTRTFGEIFPTYDVFKTGFRSTALGNGIISDTFLPVIYTLLAARYTNSHSSYSDENQFKLMVYELLYSFGPTFEKRTEIQKKLRELTEDEILIGTKVIYNHSLNPNTEPSTATLEELTTINDQNTSNTKRGRIQAYTELYSVLNANITTEFVGKFKKLFLAIVEPQLPLWYVTNEGDDEDVTNE